MMNQKTTLTERLESLDVLRGLDLFLLVCFQPVLGRLVATTSPDCWLHRLWDLLFTHVEWEGLHLWDMIMPLFLFMAGTSIPFAYARYMNGQVSLQKMLWRIARRVVVLFVLGAIAQGRLLDLSLDRLYIYTNTLQAIAMGYLFSALIYMFTRERGVLIALFVLPLIYTLGMHLYGAGYEPGTNLAEVVDNTVLGRFRDGAQLNAQGVVEFAPWYHYSWVYSTLNFTTTVSSGLLTGAFLKGGLTPVRKFGWLLLAGVASLGIAWGISWVEPVNKHLWTSSMTFLTSGISILLMACFYFLVDGLKWHCGFMWLKIYGMNSILAYMLYDTLEISSLTRFWLHGLEQYVGGYYPVVLEGAKVALIFWILRLCFKRSCFLRA